MRRASTPSPGSGKFYVRFAGITLIAALVVAMAVDSRPKAYSAPNKAPGQVASVQARPLAKASTSPFAADNTTVPTGLPSDQSSEGADRLAARVDPTRPPPGDPADQIGKQHIQAPGWGRSSLARHRPAA